MAVLSHHHPGKIVSIFITFLGMAAIPTGIISAGFVDPCEADIHFIKVQLQKRGKKDDKHIDLKEIVLRKHNPWNGQLIRDLDISRQTIIVMVKRNGTMLIPKGNLMLLEGDHVILYSQTHIANAELISI